MPSPSIRGTVAVLLATLLLAGCGGARGAATSPAPAAPAEPDRGRLDAVAAARADSLRHPYTAADVHFMTSMIGHHAQAIVMARLAPTHGANPRVRLLADRIVNAQRDEIATMQRWLRDRLQPVPEVSETGAVTTQAGGHGGHGAGHGSHGAGHAASMPGMLTAEQLAELDAARGAEFDRLFLVYMIQHHRGAVAMVKELFSTYGAAQDESVFKLASDVNVDQETEIARMERLLVEIVLGEETP